MMEARRRHFLPGMPPGLPGQAFKGSFTGLQLLMHLFKGILNIFEEDQSQYNMLIFRGIDVLPEFIRGLPKLFFDGVPG